MQLFRRLFRKLAWPSVMISVAFRAWFCIITAFSDVLSMSYPPSGRDSSPFSGVVFGELPPFRTSFRRVTCHMGVIPVPFRACFWRITAFSDVFSESYLPRGRDSGPFSGVLFGELPPFRTSFRKVTFHMGRLLYSSTISPYRIRFRLSSSF